MASTSALNPQELNRVFQVPNVVAPSDIDGLTKSHASSPALNRDYSFKITKRPPSTRHLSRHYSDCDTRNIEDDKHIPTSSKADRRSRRVRRSISAIETKHQRYRPRVKRSISDRSGLIVAGKRLNHPVSSSRPHSLYDGHSSRCSSTKTLSSNVSLSEIVAVELGLKEVPGLTPKEARRRRVVMAVILVSFILLVVSVVLVAVTLLLSPEVDEILRKGNEEIYRSMSAGASTSSPPTEGAAVGNNTTPSSSAPG